MRQAGGSASPQQTSWWCAAAVPHSGTCRALHPSPLPPALLLPARPCRPFAALTVGQPLGALHAVGLKVEACVQHVLLCHQPLNGGTVALRRAAGGANVADSMQRAQLSPQPRPNPIHPNSSCPSPPRSSPSLSGARCRGAGTPPAPAHPPAERAGRTGPLVMSSSGGRCAADEWRNEPTEAGHGREQQPHESMQPWAATCRHYTGSSTP